MELRMLLEARRDALKEVVHFIEQQGPGPFASVVALATANTKFLEAELELAKKQDERIAIFEKLLESQTVIEGEVTKGVEAGVVPKTELLIATSDRLKAEIDLHKALKKAK